MTYESGIYKLNCYQLVDQSTSPTPSLQIQSFSTTGLKSWEIKTVSKKGACVAVQQENSLLTFATGSGSFVSSQSIDITGFSTDV